MRGTSHRLFSAVPRCMVAVLRRNAPCELSFVLTTPSSHTAVVAKRFSRSLPSSARLPFDLSFGKTRRNPSSTSKHRLQATAERGKVHSDYLKSES